MKPKTMRRAVANWSCILTVLVSAVAVTANAQTSQSPTITVGTKNFTEAYVLGQLYKQALEAKGFKVAYKENIGSSELIDTALTSGKINFYPEYAGVIALNLAHVKTAPKTVAANYAAAKAFEEKRGFTLLRQTPFFDADSFAVLKRTAAKYRLKTISDLKKVPNLSYAGYPECDKRITCLLGLKQIYGLKDIKFVQTDVTVPAGKKKILPVDTRASAFAYVFEGSGAFRDASKPFGVLVEKGLGNEDHFIRDESGNPIPARIFDPWNVTQEGPDLFRRADGLPVDTVSPVDEDAGSPGPARPQSP